MYWSFDVEKLNVIKQSIRNWALNSSLDEINALVAQMMEFLELSKDTDYLINVQARYMVELEVLDEYLMNIR